MPDGEVEVEVLDAKGRRIRLGELLVGPGEAAIDEADDRIRGGGGRAEDRVLSRLLLVEELVDTL